MGESMVANAELDITALRRYSIIKHYQATHYYQATHNNFCNFSCVNYTLFTSIKYGHYDA